MLIKNISDQTFTIYTSGTKKRDLEPWLVAQVDDDSGKTLLSSYARFFERVETAKEETIVTKDETKGDDEGQKEWYKEQLAAAWVKFHHMLWLDKLTKLYNENFN